MIEVNNVSKVFRMYNERTDSVFSIIGNIGKLRRYRELWALRNISFRIKKGEFIGVIGENGSGKTTLLRVVAGILNPTKGNVKVYGKVTPFLELGLGFHDDLSGRENVYLYSQLMGLSKDEVDRKINDIVKFSELYDFIDAKLNTYSSGMKLRLAFSAAIQTDPDIMLVDEVLAVGDLRFQQKCFDVFKRFKSEKRTVLYVSHDINSVKTFCDKVLFLNNGRQVTIGKPEHVIEKYIYSVIRNKKNETDFRTIWGEPDFEHIENLKKVVNIRWGTKEIEIVKVKLLDRFNKETSIFMSGDPLRIRIYYKKNKEVKNPIFGIGIFYEDGRHCFGSNSEVDRYKIKKIKRYGYVDCLIKRLGIWEGNFYLNVMVHDDEHYHYDWHNKMYMFKVIKLNNYDQGLFNLDCKWKISK